ncbi:long-chain fatty acid--CoA ligase [Streptomyces althioticus]|uniref:long-chain-fatty-acid--CoA ligase n=2 Tax=Streptomyces TaxID=1883 RepID=UPI0036F68238
MNPTANLAYLLETTAAHFPGREAIVAGARRLTYRELDLASRACANLLTELGVGRGDVVALTCPNIPEFTIAYYGILRAGAAVVPLNTLLKRSEIAYHLNDSGASVYFCHQDVAGLAMDSEGWAGFQHAPQCRQFVSITTDPAGAPPHPEARTLGSALADTPVDHTMVAVDEDDTAVILYTSGTTGTPKGAELRHRNLRDNALLGRLLFEASPDRPDRHLSALPLFHSFGQTVCQNGVIAFAGTSVLMPRFEPQAALTLMADEKITVFAAVPTMYWALLNAIDQMQKEAGDNSGASSIAAFTQHLRVANSGGAALPGEIHAAFERVFGVTILEGYGLSETSPIAAFSPFGAPAKAGSIGLPVPGVEMKLLRPGSWTDLPPGRDVGEIAVRGHNVMKGYFGRPEATAEALRNGWLRTGDLARRDADGWYYIVDRSKDLIIRGGFNVYPREIEERLLTHPDISLCAVIGVPHPSHGEEIKAVVVRRPGSDLSETELIAWCKEKMAGYKYPRIVEFAATLPMTATGKILKRGLGAREGGSTSG